MHIVLWHRLDQPGHDACRFRERPEGWMIEGNAVFEQAGRPASLAYRLCCCKDWRTRRASVSGWIGHDALDLTIERHGAQDWRVNGTPAPAMAGLDDIDLGFTPATNTSALRRLDLREGAGATCVALWLDTEDWTVKRLTQSYRRTGPRTFAYASPKHGYRANLETDDFGAVTE